jgi:ArsR family transcriptional regulator
MNRSTFLEGSARDRARGFNALADPARLAILGQLRGGIRCVCELEVELGMASNLLSYHMRILREAGLVSGRRRGRRTEYQIEAKGFEALRRQVDALVPAGRRR